LDVPVRYGRLWAIKWAWHPAETNFGCERILSIYMPSRNFLVFIVSEILAFIWRDRQADGRTWQVTGISKEHCCSN